MSKVLGYTPAWLSHPSPGARIFSDPETQSPSSPSKTSSVLETSPTENNKSIATAARRTIARRGTEVFTVVGNKIRWADLSRVKDEWDGQGQRRAASPHKDKTSYRTFKTPVYYQIKDLSVSPSGHFLAISTEHTIHVALLPDSSRLHDGDQSEIKLKVHQLGPTTHVIPEAPLAGVVWHPLAASSASEDCLVTVTTEAAVRMWEFDPNNHWSFERPALAIDLRKLADGTSSDQDFEPSGFGKSRGFSADAFDMEAAAVSFGGRAADNEDPWAAMTLWTVMSNGDVYALCPLLPARWRPAPTTIGALATSAVSQIASISARELDLDERRAADQRYEWVQELDNEAAIAESVYLRPENPSAIPRLQGPFELPTDGLEEDTEISDIIVMPANLNEDDMYSGEDDYEFLGGAKSLPFTVICLATTDNHLHIMIELVGVTGQWLPKKGRSHFSVPTWDAGEFVLIESVSLRTGSHDVNGSPSITVDPVTPYHFFVTTGSSVLSLSLEEWASRIGFEVSEDETEDVDAGFLHRLQLACKGTICIKRDLLTPQQDKSVQAFTAVATLFEDVNIGTLLLTSSNGRANAVQLDQNSFRTSKMITQEPSLTTSISSPFRASQSLMQILQPATHPAFETPPTRAPYAPAQTFYADRASLGNQIKSRIPTQRRTILTDQQLRLSPACLEVMTAAHRTFSHQTSQVETAAAELFRRCERLREELADQVRQMAELADRLNRLSFRDDDFDSKSKTEDNPSTYSQKVSDRIEAAKARQRELFGRYERVRRKAGQVGYARQELSIKERAWVDEVDSLVANVGDGETVKKDDVLTSRLENAKSLAQDLIADAKRINVQTSAEGRRKDGNGTPDGKLRMQLGGNAGMSRYQKDKIREVREMVERESAIIDAVQTRLGNLSVG